MCLSPCFHIPEVNAGEILQMFGKMFFEFCQESGYDTILRVLGSNVREFLQVSLFPFSVPLMLDLLKQNLLLLYGIHNHVSVWKITCFLHLRCKFTFCPSPGFCQISNTSLFNHSIHLLTPFLMISCVLNLYCEFAEPGCSP